MSATATGMLAAPVAMFADLLSNSETFQDIVGATDAADALGSIFKEGLKQSNIVRPLAVVMTMPGFYGIGLAGGNMQTLRRGGMIQVNIELPTAWPVSITRSSGTATVTETAHDYDVGDTVLITGCAQDEYNGEHAVTAVTSNTYSFTVSGAPASPATGSPLAAPDPDDSGEMITRFLNKVGAIVEEICDLAGTDDYLVMNKFELVDGPSFPDSAESNTDELYVQAIFVFHWGL